MATSFRLPPDQLKKLEYLASQLGTSKAQVVKDAIDMLYENRSREAKRTMFDRLADGSFEPLELSLDFAASDERKQRDIIRAKISKKTRA